MAAFALSYHGLTRGNIRHIYSYNNRPPFVPEARPLWGSSQFIPTPLVQRYPPRFYDYYPAFNVGLPRAPAFNHLSAAEISEMVARMGKPITRQRDRQKQKRSSNEHARSRRKVKVVRFQSPTEEAADGPQSPPSNDPGDTGVKDHSSKVKVKDESEGEEGTAESDTKAKSVKLPELTGKKSQEKPKRKNGTHPTLPPIKN